MEDASQAPHLHHHHRKRRRGWEKGPYVRVHYENLSKASLDHLQNLLSSWSSWESTQTPTSEREGQEQQGTRLSGTDVYFPSSGPSSAAVPSVLSRLGPLGSFRSPGATGQGSIAPLRVWAALPPPKPLLSPSLPPKQSQPPSAVAEPSTGSPGTVGAAGVRSGVTFNKHYSTANDVPLYDRSESGLVLGVHSSRSTGVGAGVNGTSTGDGSQPGKDSNAPSDTAPESAAGGGGGDLSTLTPLFLHSNSSRTEEALKLKSAARCFNCGSYTHALRECQRPRDHAAVAAARAEHAGAKGQGGKSGNSAAGEGGVGNSRYYGFGGAGGGKGRGGGSMEERFEGLVPGVLSAELRAAMGIGGVGWGVLAVAAKLLRLKEGGMEETYESLLPGVLSSEVHVAVGLGVYSSPLRSLLTHLLLSPYLP
ncbi:unnamed protein product [Closterium sp. Yama58-4]|nr:unnamed protein product [Closterium sp. Yama58-4]